MKWVSHPLFVLPQSIKPCPKSIPNNPNAGINTRNPTPAERLKSNGL
jgi:hypothetical protein